jgi:hypothetical protein
MAAEKRRASNEARTLIGRRRTNTFLMHTASVHITLYSMRVIHCMRHALWLFASPAAFLGSVRGRRLPVPFGISQFLRCVESASSNDSFARHKMPISFPFTSLSLYLPPVVCFCYSFFDSFHDCIAKSAHCRCSMNNGQPAVDMGIQ